MIKKKDERESIEKTKLGILDGLNELENSTEDSNHTTKEYKSKFSLEKKLKRSFMLTEKQIEMVYLLKAQNPSKDLSTLVGEAIEKYFEANKPK